MATSSITKEFFVKDDTAFEKLKKRIGHGAYFA